MMEGQKPMKKNHKINMLFINLFVNKKRLVFSCADN